MLFWLLEQPSWNLRQNNESSKVLDQNQYFKWCDCFGQNLSPPFKSSSSNLKSYGVDGCCCCSRSAGIWELSVINNLWPVPLQNEAERMETRLGESKLHKFEPWTGSWPAQVLRCDEEYFKCNAAQSNQKGRLWSTLPDCSTYMYIWCFTKLELKVNGPPPQSLH